MSASTSRLPTGLERATVDDATLDAYVHSHPDGSGYHLSGWRSLIADVFDHEARALAVTRDGSVVGVLPLVVFRSRFWGRRVVSMPFLNYGGVLADDDDAARALLDTAIVEAKELRAQALELRHVVRRFADLHSKTHKVAMRLALRTSSASQWDSIDRKLRNQVRKADKSGLTVHSGGEELVDEFYDVFAENMRDLGTPVYDFRFFLEILRTFPDTARVFVVRKGGQPIASSVTYRFGSMREVPWASSLRAYNHLCANVRLYWAMLEHAIGAQCATFDFGRSTPNEGTFNFKKQWGAEPVPLVWEYWMADGRALPDLSPKNPKFSIAIRAWQSLPLAVSRVVGPPIVRHIP